MNEQRHTIMREVLEITVPERESALPIQNKISEIVKYRLNPALDSLFSEIGSKNEVIRIERLEVDLGVISSDNYEEEILTRVISSARNQIIYNVEEQKQKFSINKQQKDNSEKSNVSVFTTGQSSFEAFIHFIEKGFVPWWKESKSITPDDIFEEALKVKTGEFSIRILPLLKKTDVRKRIIFQYNESQIQDLLKKISKADYADFESLYEWMDRILPVEGSSKKILRNIFLEQVFLWFSQNRKIKSDSDKSIFQKEIVLRYFRSMSSDFWEPALIKIFIRFRNESRDGISPEKIYLVYALLSALFELKLAEKVLNNIEFKELFDQPEIKNAVQNIESIYKGNFKDEIEKSDSNNKKQKDLTEDKAWLKKNIISDKETEQDKLNLENLVDEGEKIYVSNAGLILLYPFLKFFFKGLKLLNDELQFVNKDAAYKAVHLLQILVTKQINTPENELVFNKILCGLDISEPVPLEVTISDSEKEECKHLLVSVLEQWKALKTKNPDALTETFLKREGVLSRGNQGWNLKVERNTFDVMLDCLPWQLSIIKLAWTENFIYVEW